jgi:hypothetical protein
MSQLGKAEQQSHLQMGKKNSLTIPLSVD